MGTSFDEIPEFLDIVRTKGFMNDSTANARKTACKKFVDIVEPADRTVEFVRDNLDVIKAQFSNLNKDVNGATVDEYARRVRIVIEDFTQWKADRSGWERAQAAKQNGKPAEGEKKAKPKAEKAKEAASTPAPEIRIDPTLRTVEIPLRSGEAKVTFPRDMKMADVKKIAWGLMTYATDFDPEVSTRDPFPQLAQRGDVRDTQ